MDSHPKWRLRARIALEAYLRDRSYPRLTLLLLVTFAGCAGFLISYGLLHLGWHKMAVRYPLAVLGGYAVFLVQLRIWVEIERTRYQPNEVQISTQPPEEAGESSLLEKFQRSDSDSWLDWLDFGDSLLPEEGCLFGCLFTAVLGIIVGAVTMVFSFFVAGPGFLAEVFLDAVVVSMLYRHLQNVAREHWLGTAVRKSWSSVAMAAVALGVVGFCLDESAPGSHSIGPAVKELIRQWQAL
jgi:hypothetical protein